MVSFHDALCSSKMFVLQQMSFECSAQINGIERGVRTFMRSHEVSRFYVLVTSSSTTSSEPAMESDKKSEISDRPVVH